MRLVRCRLAGFLLPLILAACGDLPTTSPAPDLASAGPLRSEDCVLLSDGTFLCPPQQPDWGDGCDEYHYDCGGDDCIMSSAPTDPEQATVQGCTGGGGGSDGGSTGPGDGGGSGGSGDGSGTGGDDGTGPFAEGPLAWAVCVLTVTGYGMSVDDVADKFETWWQTEKAVRRADAILKDLIGLRESGAYYVSESDMDMAYYRVEVATEARDAARGDVSSATGVSWAALGAAALACGASALLPTP